LSPNQIKLITKYANRILILLAVISLAAAWVYGHVAHREPVEHYLPGALGNAADFHLIHADTDNELYLFDGRDTNGDPVGYITVTHGRGYGGPMMVVVGWSLQGSIYTVRVPQHREDWPWFHILDAKKFYDQYIGRKDTDRLHLGRDIDAVTGASRSAHGVAEGVLKARELVAKKLGHRIPPSEKPAISFGAAEILLFLGLALVLMFRTLRVLNKVPFRRSLLLGFGFIVVGIWLQHPLSLVNFTTWMMGYAPPWQSNIWLYGLVLGVPALTLILGKNCYCFWFCPFSAVQEGAHLLTGSKVRPGRTCGKALRTVRYILLWLALFLAFSFHNPSLTVYEPWTALFTLKGTTGLWILVAVTLGSALVVHNFWCSYLCPVGAILELLLKAHSTITSLWQKRKR